MRKVILAVVVSSLAGLNSAQAQVRHYRDGLGKTVLKTQLLYSTRSKAAAKVARSSEPVIEADKFWKSQGKAYGMSNALTDLVPLKAEKDSIGMTHVRYQQRYKGYNVLGADALVHIGRDGLVQTVDARLAGWAKPSLTTAISKEQAVTIALNVFKQETGVDGVVDATISNAVVAPGLLLGKESDKSSYLTWAVGVAGGPELSKIFYIDTKTGVVRFEADRIRRLTRRIGDCTAIPGSTNCPSSYVGNPTYPSYHFGRREGEASWGTNPYFGTNDVDFAYEHLGRIHQYLWDRYRRNGANGNGELGVGTYPYTAATVYRDFVPGNGMHCTHASFDSTYGFINGICHDVTFPDVIAHEYAHGLTFAFRRLTYYGQTGALDESYSDVFGQLYELSQTGTTDWIIAPGSGRNLMNPSESDERSNPDRFYSPLVDCGTSDLGGVHHNSTILSHAAYLMSEGTALATPFNSCTIRAIGSDKMDQIMYRANTQYYSASETFNGAYLDWIQACNDLIGQHGITSDNCRQVTRALQAAEMNQAGICSGIPAVPPACADLCRDTDGGIKSNVAGTVYDPVTRTNKRDACVLANTSVRENYCNGDVPAWQVMKCANGCNAATGACR